jgi:hypothetical protein
MEKYAIKFPMRYLPKMLNKKDNDKQLKMLIKSQKQYKKGQYYLREKVASFKAKKSNHILNARKIYKIENITPTKELALKKAKEDLQKNADIDQEERNQMLELYQKRVKQDRCSHTSLLLIGALDNRSCFKKMHFGQKRASHFLSQNHLSIIK